MVQYSINGLKVIYTKFLKIKPDSVVKTENKKNEYDKTTIQNYYHKGKLYARLLVTDPDPYGNYLYFYKFNKEGERIETTLINKITDSLISVNLISDNEYMFINNGFSTFAHKIEREGTYKIYTMYKEIEDNLNNIYNNLNVIIPGLVVERVNKIKN